MHEQVRSRTKRICRKDDHGVSKLRAGSVALSTGAIETHLEILHEVVERLQAFGVVRVVHVDHRANLGRLRAGTYHGQSRLCSPSYTPMRTPGSPS